VYSSITQGDASVSEAMGEPPALRGVYEQSCLGGAVVDALLYSFLHAVPWAGEYGLDLSF
jgi:hypothetical protein